jgi:hypothetical protein
VDEVKRRSTWRLVFVLAVVAAIPAVLVWRELDDRPQTAPTTTAPGRGWTGGEVGDAIQHHRAEAPTSTEHPGRTSGPVPASAVAPSPAAPRPGS